MSAARVIDLHAKRIERDQKRPAPTPPVTRFFWVPVVFWVPVRWK